MRTGKREEGVNKNEREEDEGKRKKGRERVRRIMHNNVFCGAVCLQV